MSKKMLRKNEHSYYKERMMVDGGVEISGHIQNWLIFKFSKMNNIHNQIRAFEKMKSFSTWKDVTKFLTYKHFPSPIAIYFYVYEHTHTHTLER